MNRHLKRRLDGQLGLLLPGGRGWPCYAEADTRDYWFGWHERTPLATRLALTASVLLLGLYCRLQSWLHGAEGGTARHLAWAERSRFFAVRQSFLMVKTLGCLAYFSDPGVLATAEGEKEGLP